jgi:hypothetical protein
MRLPTISLLSLLLLVPLVSVAQAARLNLPDFAGLEKKASQSVDISLDGTMLNLAGRFMSADNPNEAAVKELLTGLRGIYVRSYQFDADHAYSKTDVESVRSQLAAPGWARVVSTHDRKGEQDVDIYMRQSGNQMQGLVIVASQPRELTIVNIVGSIDLEKLRQLEGKFGVPKLDLREADGHMRPAHE